MIRFYLCQTPGSGTSADPYTAPILPLPGATYKNLACLDLRPYTVIGDGNWIVWGDVTDAEHALVAALPPSTTYLPFEAAGVPVAMTSPLSSVDSANITLIKNALEAAGVPTDGITLSMTVRQGMQVILRRAMMKRVLRDLDFVDWDLAAQVNTLSALRRKAINRALTNWGYNTSVVTGTMTLRQAIIALMDEPNTDTLLARMPGYSI